jgi:hypothetical protein
MKTTITLKLGDSEHVLKAANFLLFTEDENGNVVTAAMVGTTEAVGWPKAELFRRMAQTLAEDRIIEIRLLGQEILQVYDGWKKGVHAAADERKKKGGGGR